MTNHLLTSAEIKASHSYWDGLSDNAVKRLQVLLQLQIDHCDIPARQREAVDMVFERIENRFSKEQIDIATQGWWDTFKQEILDKIGGSDENI